MWQFDYDCNIYVNIKVKITCGATSLLVVTSSDGGICEQMKEFPQLELVESKFYSWVCMRWSDMKDNNWVKTFTSDISAFSDDGDPAADCRDRYQVLACPHLSPWRRHAHPTHPFIHPSIDQANQPASISNSLALMVTKGMTITQQSQVKPRLHLGQVAGSQTQSH